jgi:hypothetical protein
MGLLWFGLGVVVGVLGITAWHIVWMIREDRDWHQPAKRRERDRG